MKLDLRIAVLAGLTSLLFPLVACSGASPQLTADGGAAAGGGGGTTAGGGSTPGGGGSSGGGDTGSSTGGQDAGGGSGTSPPSTGGSPPATGSDDGGGAASGPVSSKRGLAYGSNSEADLAALSSGVSWWYNWSSSPDSTLPKGYDAHGIEYVPMIWGGNFNTTQLATQIPAGAKYLLTFNEPNFNAQSNLTPTQAAALWPQIQAFADAHNLLIVSPALNYCGGGCNETNPFTWLDAFFAACSGCRVDYIGAHWYACYESALKGYLSDYETKYTQPIWLTEFSCLDGSLPATDANETTYMTNALALLEADPRVFRYSWFTGRSTGSPAISVLGDSGVLTALGQTYTTLPH